MEAIDQQRTKAKSLRNKRDYEKSKIAGEHVLLRLDPGGSLALDEAAKAAGLSRAAFARIFLPAIVAAVGDRYMNIERARAAGSRSLGQFLTQAIDQAIALVSNSASDPPSMIASEFDSMFRTED